MFLSVATVLLATAQVALAGFNSAATNNLAIYWGQNSYGQASGNLSQQRLSYYCANTNVDIIPLAFITRILGKGGYPETNFANAGNNCTTFAGTNLWNCPQIAEDIVTCQKTYSKTILLALGGSTYTYGGFASTSDAISGAKSLWNTFGKYNSTSNRPFGTAVIDGFDLDFESTFNNGPTFASQLRTLMNSDTSKKYYLTAAPQCPYPDQSMSPMLNSSVPFDALFIQFYNNYCGVQSFTPGTTAQANFNFQIWDSWAKSTSANKAVKLFLGVPAGPTAAGSGYEPASALAGVVNYCKTFSSFGGVMAWDVSQGWANAGWVEGVKGLVNGKTATTSASTTASTTRSATSSTTSTKVAVVTVTRTSTKMTTTTTTRTATTTKVVTTTAAGKKA